MSERRARLCLGLLMVCICGSLGFAHDITGPIRRAGMLRGLIALAFAVPAVLGVRALARRELLRELVRRDVEEAYSGAAFAKFWAFAHPLLIILL